MCRGAASLSAPSNVLIKGNIIERISTEPIAAEPGVAKISSRFRKYSPFSGDYGPRFGSNATAG
jgi:hypothetical protein